MTEAKSLARTIARPAEAPRVHNMNTANFEATPYGARGLEEECRAIAEAKDGERNNKLNSCAFSIAQLVAGGEIPEGEARREILRAARACGIKEREALATIDSAFKGGMKEPRSAPPREQAPRWNKIGPVTDDYTPSDDDAPDAPPFEVHGMDVQASKLPLLKILGPAEIFAPLPPLEYLVEQLVVRGTATQVLAYGSSGKSWVGFNMATTCAAGTPFLGRFPTKKCRALYLDFENGLREAMRRIQAIAKARGIEPNDLALGLCSMPSMYLDDPRFVAEIRALASSYDLFIVDTLRAATRGEENASEARRPIDAIKSVIEETKGALVVLSHTKKISQSVTKIDPREAGRGSSAIFDAFDAVLHLAYEEGEPLLATQTKGRSGRFVDPFGITITDTENGGVDVLAVDPPDKSPEAPSAQFMAKCDAAVAFLRKVVPGATGRALRDELKCSGQTLDKVTGFLSRNGVIENRSARANSPVWHYRGTAGQ